MKINKSSWHARIYRWWHWDKYDSGSEGVNLCKYVRVVLLYGPLRWLFNGEVRSFPIGVVTFLFLIGSPLMFITNWEALGAVLLAYASILGIALLLVVCWALQKYEVWDRIKGTVGAKVKSTPFLSILKLVYLSGKKKVCPYVDFGD